MPSYFRNWFGGSSSNSQPGSSTSSKSHTRSKSANGNIYATPASTITPSASRPDAKRSQSYNTSHATTPSPLRFAAGTSTSPSVQSHSDTRSTYGYGRRGSAGSHTAPELRPQVLRRATAPHHPIYSPSAGQFTPASSRSNSNSSFLTSMSSPYGGSRSDHGHYHHTSPSHASDTRPPLTSNNSWQTSSVGSTGSSYGSLRGHSRSRSDSLPSAYVQPRPTNLHMHPLLAYTRLHRAPITYDVSFTPSARTVLDRATHSAIPSHTLAQPATEPPTPATSRLVLRSHKFPWHVIVSGSGPRFTIGPPSQKRGSKTNAITNLDVLYSVHTMLQTPVTPEEWEALGHGSRAQQKVTKAYEKRCTRMGGGWEGGVRRIDWLGEKTRLVGVEMDKSAAGSGSGKLVFSKA